MLQWQRWGNVIICPTESKILSDPLKKKIAKPDLSRLLNNPLTILHTAAWVKTQIWPFFFNNKPKPLMVTPLNFPTPYTATIQFHHYVPVNSILISSNSPCSTLWSFRMYYDLHLGQHPTVLLANPRSLIRFSMLMLFSPGSHSWPLGLGLRGPEFPLSLTCIVNF